MKNLTITEEDLAGLSPEDREALDIWASRIANDLPSALTGKLQEILKNATVTRDFERRNSPEVTAITDAYVKADVIKRVQIEIAAGVTKT